MLADEPRESFGSDMEGVQIKLKPPDSACGTSCKNWIEEINTYHPSYQSGGGGGGGATIIFKVYSEVYSSRVCYIMPAVRAATAAWGDGDIILVMVGQRRRRGSAEGRGAAPLHAAAQLVLALAA